MIIHHNKYEIEIIDDNYYSSKSSDNTNSYSLEYTGGEISKNRVYSINKRGVRVRDAASKSEISSAILYENGGKTSVGEEIFKVEEDKLWLCVGDKLYCLSIPNLEIIWFNQVDYGTNYSINYFNEDFIIYGDLGVVRISKTGEVKWKFMGGGGIFLPGEGKLKILEKHIELIDGNNEKFKISADGTLIS